MNRITKRAFVVLCVWVLAACGSSPKLSTERPEGFIATTITSDGGRAWYAIVVENIDTKVTYHFGIGNASWKPHLLFVNRFDEDLKAEGRPLVATLPVGRYVITGWGIESGFGRGYHNAVTPPLFNVEAGKTTYLGNVHFSNIAWDWRTKAQVTLSDQSARDLPLLKKRFDTLAGTPLFETIAPGTKHVMVTGEGGPETQTVARIYVRATP
jgi:hypothetical protein